MNAKVLPPCCALPPQPPPPHQLHLFWRPSHSHACMRRPCQTHRPAHPQHCCAALPCACPVEQSWMNVGPPTPTATAYVSLAIDPADPAASPILAHTDPTVAYLRCIQTSTFQ